MTKEEIEKEEGEEEVTSDSEMTKEEEYLQGWKRARAELDNFKKRIASDAERQREYMKRDLIEPMLSLADNFEAITAHVPAELQDNPWTQGVLHVVRQLQDILSGYGVEVIDAIDVEFNPAIHEASEPGGEDASTVGEVVRKGYKIGDTVIRPAQVKVK